MTGMVMRMVARARAVDYSDLVDMTEDMTTDTDTDTDTIMEMNMDMDTDTDMDMDMEVDMDTIMETIMATDMGLARSANMDTGMGMEGATATRARTLTCELRLCT